MECYEKFDILKNRNEGTRAIALAKKVLSIFEENAPENEIREDWIFSKQQNFKEKYMVTAKFLADCYFSENNYDESINLCNKIISIDPCDEEIHRHLMLCYYQAGRVHLALRQYNRCFESLSKDLKLLPEASTTELFHRIRQRS